VTAPVVPRRLARRVDHDAVLDLGERLIRTQGHQDLPAQERAVADLLAAELSTRLPADRCDVFVSAFDGDRANVTAVVRGSLPGPTLMLNGHLDTVPGYGMRDAYRPAVRDGRLYGRGAVDMKAALAAMVACLEVLSAPDVTFRGQLVLTAVAGEESGSAGMAALTAVPDPGVPARADFAIVGEPTSMNVARAHKGAMWIEVEFEGLATHGSVPHEGINATYHAARFITAVETRLVPRLSARTHPVLGSATVNVGVVRGGDRPPMVPAQCSVQLDRRWLPGERHEEVLDEVRGIVAELRQADPRVSAVVREMDGTSAFVHAPLECPAEHPGVVLLSEVVGERLPDAAEPVGVNFWTDGALLAARTGTPTVVCGPGDIAQAHSLDEWIALEQVHAATEVYVEFAARFLGAELSGASGHG
jgi:acetylornithine deacetylase/succinyl-diaminopimelate desuccinylase